MNENEGHTATLVNSDALCVSFDPPGFRHAKDNTISYFVYMWQTLPLF